MTLLPRSFDVSRPLLSNIFDPVLVPEAHIGLMKNDSTNINETTFPPVHTLWSFAA